MKELEELELSPEQFEKALERRLSMQVKQKETKQDDDDYCQSCVL